MSCWSESGYRCDENAPCFACKDKSDQSSTATVQPRLIYICHAYSGYGTIEGNKESVRLIARTLEAFGDTPLAPQLMLPEMYDEATERDRAMTVCLRLVAACDVVEVHGQAITHGMFEEIAHALKLGKPVVDRMTGLRLLLPKK